MLTPVPPASSAIMPKHKPKLSAKSQKAPNKRKRSSSAELTNVCNITGLNDGILSTGMQHDNLLDCLEELATAQVQETADSSCQQDESMQQTDASKDRSTKQKISNTISSTPSPVPPPGIHRIPNLKIELSRHLQVENVSTFLIQSCPGNNLRMPTFERWLLDSKLEERDRYESILMEWEEDPSSKLEIIGKKKKYGRAALYDRGAGDFEEQRLRQRKDQESRLLLATEKFCCKSNNSEEKTWESMHNLNVDPILPSQPLETDPCCIRLLEEVTATLSLNPTNSTESDSTEYRMKASEIVKELCRRTSEAVSNIQQMEVRLGKYQKFGWDTNVTTTGTGSKKKKKRDGGKSGNSANMDKINIEWHGDNQVCSLVYVPKKKRSHGTDSGDKTHGEDASTKNKPKPFVVKLNASHYHKMRSMFDKTYETSFNSSDGIEQLSKSQVTHAFHAILFAMIIRYSSLAGGQQLNDLRGGGMQGAIHDKVFDCLGKWFGKDGTESFASPFNCHLPRFYSAFSSDIDGHFGSYGDFYRSSSTSTFLQNGWYELNPPFSPGVMDKMATRIEELLDLASEKCLDVTFVVVVPTCQDDTVTQSTSSKNHKKLKGKRSKRNEDAAEVESNEKNSGVSSLVHQSASTSFNRLALNPQCISHIILPAREHGYVEGSQHLRPTKYKESKYNSSVITLRSRRSAKKAEKSGKSTVPMEWDKDLFEKDLREAFASLHKVETKERKSGEKVMTR